MVRISVRSEPTASARRRLTSMNGLRGAIFLSAATLTACTAAPNYALAPPEPVPVEKSYVTASYRIQVGDVLDIRLILNPELNEEVTVRPDGHVSTTIVTDTIAAGLTVPEFAAVLSRDYAGDLRNPRVSVIVKSVAPTRIYVGGEVTTPGEFTIAGTAPTLSQAIARAGGTKMSSDDARVFIIRRDANDTPEFLATRYDAVQREQDPTADVRLAPYDVVYVPKTGTAEVYQWYNQHIQQFINPSVGVSYVLDPNNAGTVVLPGR
jgi:polysaccharide export outer membrane protein